VGNVYFGRKAAGCHGIFQSYKCYVIKILFYELWKKEMFIWVKRSSIPFIYLYDIDHDGR
jgi:hypothetical protein